MIMRSGRPFPRICIARHVHPAGNAAMNSRSSSSKPYGGVCSSRRCAFRIGPDSGVVSLEQALHGSLMLDAGLHAFWRCVRQLGGGSVRAPLF